MCMSCRGSNRKRIAIITGAGAGAAGIAYASLAANPAATAALPVVLLFAACPAMCAGMWGAMWLGRRLSRRNNVIQPQLSHTEANELAAEDRKIKSQSEASTEIVQYQNQHKRKTKQDGGADPITQT